jgi:hypothetical protein
MPSSGCPLSPHLAGTRRNHSGKRGLQLSNLMARSDKAGESGLETDSLAEEDGFELAVPPAKGKAMASHSRQASPSRT